MKKITLIVLCLFCFINVNAQDELTKEHKEVIADFINCFKNNDRQKLAGLVRYPFKREYPIPSIKNKEDFLKRFDEVFDSKFIAEILNSNISKDWNAVGWRGIMLDNGSLWIDYDGTLLGVNYQSDDEAKEKAILIESEKANLHPSISNFTKPICILLTKKYRIRIDEMPEGKYRYASWKIAAKMSDKPDLVIQTGKFLADGMENHYYIFKNGNYTYKCDIILVGEDDAPPAYLTIYKDGKEILDEDAVIVEP